MTLGESQTGSGRTVVRHLGIAVPDLRQAEGYYVEHLGMEVLFRESLVGNTGWHTLSRGVGWEEALEGDVPIDMVALRHPAFVLALFQTDQAAPRLKAVGISDRETERFNKSFELMDPFGIAWQFTGDGQFQSNGEISNRWV